MQYLIELVGALLMVGVIAIGVFVMFHIMVSGIIASSRFLLRFVSQQQPAQEKDDGSNGQGPAAPV